MKRFGVLAAAPLILGGVLALVKGTEGQQRPPQERLKVNTVGMDYARQLIAEHHVVNDKHGNWQQHQRSTEVENNFIGQRGSEEYCRWHLGIDESHSINSKARYKFPFGDFENVHRCALIAAQNRARQHRYDDIEKAATELLNLLNEQQ